MSESLNIEKTKSSPKVVLDMQSKELLIEGQSYPENAYAFYQPLLDELSIYFKSNEKLTVKIRLVYINTSSYKIILDIMDLLEDSQNSGAKIKIEWYYDSDNDVAMETGEEIKEDISLEFELIEEE